jgi:hypothetical protein
MVLGKLDMYKYMIESRTHHPIQEKNSKWVKDLMIRVESLYLLVENKGKFTVDIGLVNAVLNKTPVA